MEFKVILGNLSERIGNLDTESIKTEEAAKTSLILPFLQTLGFDVFNPTEVVPEFDADVGVKKGEKVDYAIIINNEPVIIIEAKACNDPLELHGTQLLRYFHATKAQIAILTNGLQYKLFTDLKEKNKMDETPFFSFDLSDLRDSDVDEIAKFCKDKFDISNILSSANFLKYRGEIRQYLRLNFPKPQSEFVEFLTRKVYHGQIRSNVLSEFELIVEQAFRLFINEMISDRLKTAMQKEVGEEDKDDEKEEAEDHTSKIITTTEELEGFQIVRAMLCRHVDAQRISYRDTQSYLGILLDDNNRKAICRLFLGEKKKSLIVIFADKTDSGRIELSSVADLFQHEALLVKSLKSYLS